MIIVKMYNAITLKNFFLYFSLDNLRISRISLDPCKTPKEKIKRNPKIISNSGLTFETIQSPIKLATIEKLHSLFIIKLINCKYKKKTCKYF